MLAADTNTGRQRNGIGMKYSELGNSQAEGRRKNGALDARYQGNVELDGGERFEIHDEHAHEIGPGPIVRHELGTHT